MAAQSLPLETLLQIFGYIPGGLAQYASVCRAWQIAVEKLTFADLHIDSSNLEEFDEITTSTKSPGRSHHVKNLFFKVKLPEYSFAARGWYETQRDRDCNNRVFTQAIASLFQILSLWPNGSYEAKHLEICSLSPCDWRAEEDWPGRSLRQQTAMAFPEQELLGRRYESSYLEILEDTHISNAMCITSVRFPGYSIHRKTAPKAFSKIISHLPRLQNINAELRDDERDDELLRDGLRNNFTTTGWPQSLRCLKLSYDGPSPQAERLAPPKRSSPGRDSLCIALHQLSQQLESIELSKIMIGPELFWPAGASKSNPVWPNLVTFNMSYQPATTSGRWLFERDPAMGDQSDEPLIPDLNSYDRFRILPNQHINEIYLSAAYAARNMPRLKRMYLEAEIVSVLAYGPLSQPTHVFDYQPSMGMAIWLSSSEFHVTDDVRRAWDAVSKSHGHSEIHANSIWIREQEYYDDDPTTCTWDERQRKKHKFVSWDD